MQRKTLLWLSFSLLFVAATPAEPVDWEMVTRIRDEGFNHSHVMDTLSYLTDVIGGRLTGSPAMKRANQWTRDQLSRWGLENAHLESWGPFGRGWSFSHSAVHMVSPLTVPLPALPKAWTPGTEGAVRGQAMRVLIESEKDFDKYRGKLAGKILFLSPTRKLRRPKDSAFRRYSGDQLEEISEYRIRGDFRFARFRKRFLKRRQLQGKLRDFFRQEKALATVEISRFDNGVLLVSGGGSRKPGEDPGIPALVMAAESYNRVARLLERKMDVELEIDVRATFHDQDRMAYNTVAEIPGTDLKDEIVMLGAHMDSWHPGTGATDNGAGTAVTMEVVRILQSLGIHPRRTIRIALWSGEEEGLLGSRAYVAQHFASRPEPKDPAQRRLPSFLRRNRGPLTLKPEHAKLSVYFNLDNGSGKIRGIYAQQNAAAVPIFEAWLKPFHDLGARTISLRDTGGTDHLSFDAVGLPGFQFIQDQLDYFSRTHHTNLDVLDHVEREDLMQASVIMASFVYHAAMREGRFPRKPLPRPAKSTKVTTGRPATP